jgi:hypothetical protein
VVAPTLGKLTLKFSRDLEALEAQCTKRLDGIEKARDEALMEIAGVKKILTSYNRGLAKAKAAHLRDIQEANEIRDNEIRTAEENRRGSAAKEESKYRKAKVRAFRTRQTTLRKAKAKWRADITKIRKQPLTAQRALRKAADQRYEDATAAAREAYHEAIENARLAHQSALQDILAEERYAFEQASQTVERMYSSAVVNYERAVAEEEARMRNELAKNPAAREIQEAHDRQLAQTRRDCERKKEALFKKFSEDRKKLSY